MPNADEIRVLLAESAHRALAVAVAWHVILAIVAVALGRG
jgi:hypothetical protein